MKKDSRDVIIRILFVVSGVSLILFEAFKSTFVSMEAYIPLVFMYFIALFGIIIAAYLSLDVLLMDLVRLHSSKSLIRTFYWNKKADSLSVNETSESIIKQESALSLDEIKRVQRESKEKEQAAKWDIAFNYTRNCFALYVSDEHIDVLCKNMQFFFDKTSCDYLNSDNLHPLDIDKTLSVSDLRHFGWNIKNHFKSGLRIDVAHFLKKVFPEIFKDAEINTIKSHLKDEAQKGIIKIKENLLDQ